MQRVNALFLFVLVAGCATGTNVAPEILSAVQLRAETQNAFEQGDLETVRLRLRQLEARGIADTSTLHIALQVYEMTGDYARARAAADKILQMAPGDVQALETRGLLLLRQNRFDAAWHDLESTVALDASRWRAWNGIGIIADQQGRHEDARSAYENGLSVLPDQPQLLANLGWSWLLAGNPARAEEFLRSSFAIEPDSRVTQSNLALAIALQGRYDEAYSLYTSLYDNAIAANNTGYAAYLRGDIDAAGDYFQNALRASARYYETAAGNLARVGVTAKEASINGHSDLN